jgi:RNA polymerase sigma-70 factor (ECF subfamily)
VKKEFEKSVRAVRVTFLDEIEPHRRDLYRYCRGLTGSVWDAEDLVQEALLRAFAKLAELHWDVANPRAWLFTVATNVWRDRMRKDEPHALPGDFDAAAREEPARPEVREALLELARTLPAQERAALLMKDVFDFSLEETARALATSTGAVKAALHRGRARLEDRAPEKVMGQRTVSDALLDRFVERFNARDLDGLAALFLDEARANVVGMVEEHGLEQIKKGSLFYTVHGEEGDARAERVVYRGEPVLVLHYLKDGKRAVGDVLRFVERDGKLASLDYFYFSPELLEEVCRELGLPVQTNGHRY